MVERFRIPRKKSLKNETNGKEVENTEEVEIGNPNNPNNAMNPEKCNNCYYRKTRDVDPQTGQLAWGPWCLESGHPVRCKKALEEARCCNGDNS